MEGEEAVHLSVGKKRKLLELHSQLENEYVEGGDVDFPAKNSASPAASGTSVISSKHDASNDVLNESSSSVDLKNVDLQSKIFEAEISTSINKIISRETTSQSEFYGDSEEVKVIDSSSSPNKKPTAPIARRRISPEVAAPPVSAEKMPSTAELEEFFSAAEKYEQKRFAEKYNYDIVKDIPLEGKYHWVRLKH